jgi:four helix bundle protein
MEYHDLEVYQRLLKLALEISELTMSFPKFEMYELGSQLRRSSNSAPANLAEGFGNKHTNIYTECINRAKGEIRETSHHLTVAYKKKYFNDETYTYFVKQYDECSRMLFGLNKSLIHSKL